MNCFYKKGVYHSTQKGCTEKSVNIDTKGNREIFINDTEEDRTLEKLSFLKPKKKKREEKERERVTTRGHNRILTRVSCIISFSTTGLLIYS